VVEPNQKSEDVVGKEPDQEELPLQSIVVGTRMSSVAVVKLLSVVLIILQYSSSSTGQGYDRLCVNRTLLDLQ